jgi:hypothetical protein
MFMAVYNPLVGRFFIGTSVYLLRFFTWVSEKIASLPYASIVTGKISLGELILCYVLLGICLIMIYFSGFRSKGRSLKGKHIDKIGICILMSLFFFIIFRSKYDGFSICFLDVGQGASIYIKSETGNDYLIDGGSSDEKNIGEYKLESFLEARQVDSLEYVFVTHCDSDHTSGIIELIERGNIVIGKIPEGEPEWLTKNGELKDNGVWYYNTKDVHALIASVVQTFMRDNLPETVLKEMKNTVKEYRRDKQKYDIEKVYVSTLFEKRLNELQLLVDYLNNNNELNNEN